MDLTKDTAVFDKTTGVLEIAASPASLTSVKVKIKKIGTLKTDTNGNSKVVEVDAGTYYVKGARRFLINERS